MLPALVLTVPQPAAAPARAPRPAVPPPAAVQPAAARNVVFPGFNGLSLAGTVEPPGAHAYVAVLVADAGPTDRDWSNPAIRNPQTGQRIASHGGRDFAAWLRDQGIGSLRYDKRFVGSRDPKLDISLDAQAGDIRAALAAARALPEARGKKLLLVGHGEGALLALLASREADALLLLAMPGAPMRRTILDQVKAQLPPALQDGNLGYLESALAALGEGRELPAAGAKVHPAIAQLARSLATPESRAFVRATLDLDPWLLAARSAVPTAVAYGDRDIQNRRPSTIPGTFKGAVIDLPGANHLLKREPRQLAAIQGPAAVTTYGDDAPLADLGPLAAWLKDLK